jgi:hypothetical protein
VPYFLRHFTVTAEKETRHIAASRQKNSPASDVFSDFSSSCMYLWRQTNVIQKYFICALQNTRSFRSTYSAVIWWWHIQSSSCCFCFSSGPVSDSTLWPHPCSGVAHPSPIRERFARSFSSWLHATHTSVAYKPWKLANTLVTSTNAVNCHIPNKRNVLVSVWFWITHNWPSKHEKYFLFVNLLLNRIKAKGLQNNTEEFSPYRKENSKPHRYRDQPVNGCLRR